MAPSATTTVTEPAQAPKKYTVALGQYKELAPSSYDDDTEKGKKGEPAAKVSPRRTAYAVQDKWLNTNTTIVSQLSANMGSRGEICPS